MTTQQRQPMRGTAKLPVKKAKTHQVDLFEMMGEAFNPHAIKQIPLRSFTKVKN
jgi:hypothetical protein